MQTGQRAFDLVCQNLTKLGAISLKDFLASQNAAPPLPVPQLEYGNVCAETDHREDNSEEVLEHAPRLMNTVVDKTVIPDKSDLHVNTIESACRNTGASLYWATYSQDNWTHLGASV